MKGKGKQIILIISSVLSCYARNHLRMKGTYVIDDFYVPTPLNTTNKMWFT